MKKIYFLFVVFLILVSCKKNYPTSTASINNQIVKKDSNAVVIDSAAVNIDSSQIQNSTINETPYKEPEDGCYTKEYKDGNLIAKVYYRRENHFVNYYKVEISEKNKRIQIINQKSESDFLDEDYIGLNFIDANFDGEKDILITKFVGMNFDEKFLFLNVNGKYIRYTNFEKVTSPQVDSKNKEITSVYRSGSEHFSIIYKWKHGKLIKVSESVYDEDHPD